LRSWLALSSGLSCGKPILEKHLSCCDLFFRRYYGTEFPLAFKLAVEAAGIRHRYIKPRRPQQNGKVERSHRVDQEEFWSQHDFATREEADAPLADWARRYNHERFSMALQGRTPAEKLHAKQAAQYTGVQ
jgi:transposase InsO family protein